MQTTLLPTGRIQVQDECGFTGEIGPEHPHYERLRAHYQAAKRNSWRTSLLGLAMIAMGAGGWWYNWHLAANTGEFYIKLCVLGPLGILGGILMMLRPDWAGPIRSDSTRAHKTALAAVLGLMVVASGIDFYLLKSGRFHQSPAAKHPLKLYTASAAALPAIAFMSKKYRLGSYNQKKNPTWEFITADESIDDWSTLLTIIDRPDAHTHQELDGLAEGIMSTYKSHGGQVLLARTMQSESGDVFNYIMAAFEEPAKQRFELNFVKVALGEKNAVVVVYGVRITDPQNYLANARQFLNENSGEVGHAVGQLALPDIDKLPRNTF
jgi:hypothetical protein